MTHVKFTFLGQAGFLFEYDNIKWLIDPYLTNYVGSIYGQRFNRLYPFDWDQVDLSNIDFCLITHAHEDHCDPLSVEKLLNLNPQMMIICDLKSKKILEAKSFSSKMLAPKVGESIRLHEHVQVSVVPSAHTELLIKDGFSEFNGYVMRFGKTNFYHPGDTIPHRKIESYLPESIDLAFLPINERNFFRDEMGIIGNMTPRESLQWSKELNVKHLVPTHWDMFGLNSVDPKEFLLVAKEYSDIQVTIPEKFKVQVL